MSSYFTLFVSLGILSPLQLAAGAILCSEKESLLKEKPRTMQLSDCLMECTGIMYFRKLQLQDMHNIRLTDSSEGDPGEYCWTTELTCTIGESFQRAYLVVPEDISVFGQEMLEVKTTGPTPTTLRPHNGHTTIAESCGLRYDVTQHFSTPYVETSFCVQVIAREHFLGDTVLKCPPYLVTFWERNGDQSNQEGGG